ncbi:MAG: hypothetical protein ABIL06_03360 [Pseudomonadota bacterium]
MKGYVAPKSNGVWQPTRFLNGEGSITVTDIGKVAMMPPGSSTYGMLTTDFV